MWTIKTFKTNEAKNAWIEKNGHRYQIVEVFINNGYALDVRKLRIIG
jgi:hypothetical protein